LRIFAAKATTVLTNVPGPPIPLFLAGAEIDNIMFWVPQSGRLGLGISILSYAGNVYLGVVSDAGLVPDPELIIDGFYEEYDLLMKVLDLKQTPRKTVPTPTIVKAKAKASKRIDDLTRINGIDPKVASILQKQGITAYSQLANTQTEKLMEILAEGGKQYQKIDPASWPNQARYLASINSA
jgi:predicted flap endonuclease-1-like 5' DNA nuclease